MSFTQVIVTETFDADAPGGPLPTGDVVFTLSERIHDGSGNELEPQGIVATLEGQITISTSGATGGTFTLTWNGLTTATIAWDAAASAVLSALNLLTGFSALNASASGGTVQTTPVVITIPGDPQTITAAFGSLTGSPVPTIASASGISQALDANDDSATVPTGSYYDVEFFFTNVGERPPVTITVPHAAEGGTCTLASLS